MLIFLSFFAGKVDEKATQLHAIASLKVSLDYEFRNAEHVIKPKPLNQLELFNQINS